MSYNKINDLKLQNKKIASELLEAVNRVLASGWYALGTEVKAFENAFAAWCGVSYCRGVGNGTDALELALKAVKVERGCEVIVAANAGMYSTTAIGAVGADVVYADIDPSTYCMSPDHVAELVNPRTRAIIATHLYGHLCDMPTLQRIAKKADVSLIEDCAQAHGATLNGIKAGAWGDAAAFSFYPTKNLGALGDGGAVMTNHPEVCQAVTQLRQYGWEEKYKVVRSGGRNSRLDELQAAILSTKLKHLDSWNEQRRAIAKYYSENIEHARVKVPSFAGERHVYHLYVVRSKARDELKSYLESKDIAVDIHYPILDYRQEVFAKQLVANTVLPHSELAAQEVLTLPCYPELGLDSAKFISSAINNWRD